MPRVVLGNKAALDRGIAMTGHRITSLDVPAGYSDSEVVNAVADPRDGLWVRHSSDPGPAWVESDDEGVADLLAAHYGCPVGRPKSWKV